MHNPIVEYWVCYFICFWERLVRSGGWLVLVERDCSECQWFPKVPDGVVVGILCNVLPWEPGWWDHVHFPPPLCSCGSSSLPNVGLMSSSPIGSV